MFSIEQFRYGPDNLGYVVHADGEAMAIDGGAAGEILAFVRERGLKVATERDRWRSLMSIG